MLQLLPQMLLPLLFCHAFTLAAAVVLQTTCNRDEALAVISRSYLYVTTKMLGLVGVVAPRAPSVAVHATRAVLTMACLCCFVHSAAVDLTI